MRTIRKFTNKGDTPTAEQTKATRERFYNHAERTPSGARFCQRLDVFGCPCSDAEAAYCGSARWLGE